jgi:hypothetical protein
MVYSHITASGPSAIHKCSPARFSRQAPASDPQIIPSPREEHPRLCRHSGLPTDRRSICQTHA